jgi:hypothetical protein
MTSLAQQALEAGATSIQTKVAYTSSATGLGVSVLTINEMVGIVVGIASIVTMVITAYSNHKRNKMQMLLLERQLKDPGEPRTKPDEPPIN